MSRPALLRSIPPSGNALARGGLAEYPGAAATITLAGEVLEVVGRAAAILDAVRLGGSWPDVLRAVARAVERHTALVEVVGTGEAIEMTALPLEGGAALVLFRPMAFESALRGSLIESRQRYKDLIALAADFLWETDGEGRFSLVSPEGLLDWPAEELVGRAAAEFVGEPGAEPSAAAFMTKVPVRDAELWFRRADGGREYLGVAAVPLFDRDGVWSGARGVGRILTEERRLRNELARARLQDRLLVHLSRTMRNEDEPAEAIAAALSAIGLALAADGGSVLRLQPSGELASVAQWGDDAGGGVLDDARLALVAGQIDLARDHHFLIGRATRFSEAGNGCLLLWRGSDRNAFSIEDRATMAAAAEPFGGAIAQLTRYEGALSLAHRDPVTGLLNRRGFLAELGRRLTRLAHAPSPACLLCIDVDNFKLVNDTRGHAAGDGVLRDIGTILHDNSRSGDLIARFGGDEFVMWLDGVPADTADQRAAAILDQFRPFGGMTGNPQRRLGLSVGLAAYDPHRPETPDELVSRADAAMYGAKRSGGSAVAHAEPGEAASAAGEPSP